MIWWLLMGMLSFLVACSPLADPQENILHEASVQLSGDTLYGQASLHPRFIQETLSMLDQGEPLLFVYEWHFYRVRAWGPDEEMMELSQPRRLRFMLILQSFEMQEMAKGQVNYSSDPDQAAQFFGKPRYISLLPGKRLEQNSRYYLTVRFRMEQEGASRLFRILNRWLTLQKSVDYQRTVDYHHP